VIVAFDNTFFTLVINADAQAQVNPETNQPVQHYQQRIDALIDRLSANGDQVIIPSPAYAEALCTSENLERVLKEIEAYTAIEIRPFDAKSAIEFAKMTREAIANGDKRSGSNTDWQRVKFDR